MEPLNFAIQTARQAGDVLLQYFQPAGLHGQMKADRTPVTEADIAADRLINQAIRQNFPQDGIISEETNT